MEDIEAGLIALKEEILDRGISSIAIPPLGSGLGGLDWADVLPRIEAQLAQLSKVETRIYEPQGAPESDKMVHNRKVPTMTAGRAALVELINRYMSGLLDPAITLLEVHKLMYFMQEAGEGLRLKYVQANYGPYAENLRHVLNAIEGHFVSGYADGGDAPGKPLVLVPGAAEEASAFLAANQPTRARFDRVGKLVDGFETPFGLELLATVHWLAKREEGVSDLDTLVDRTYAWSERKRQFTPRQIQVAAEVLAKQGWIDPIAKPKEPVHAFQ
jgi:O-acetyl-ADP-ribose deacetylase (regulator of RNase III)